VGIAPAMHHNAWAKSFTRDAHAVAIAQAILPTLLNLSEERRCAVAKTIAKVTIAIAAVVGGHDIRNFAEPSVW
jgi:hypothetical protein